MKLEEKWQAIFSIKKSGNPDNGRMSAFSVEA